MKNSYSHKKAFTLAESLVVMVIISFLTVILLGSIRGMQPDRQKIMFKKAYQLTERTVGELVNDETIYPYDFDNIGFYNKSEASVPGTTTTYQGDRKFCSFFARKLNTFEPAVWNDANKTCSFQTTDNIEWKVESNFLKLTKPSIKITVDVNGSLASGGKGPDSKELDLRDRDIFEIFVDFDGRVRVEGKNELEHLRSHKVSADN